MKTLKEQLEQLGETCVILTNTDSKRKQYLNAALQLGIKIMTRKIKGNRYIIQKFPKSWLTTHE